MSQKAKPETDLEVEKLWDEMNDVPFDWDENNELYLVDRWGPFEAGTPREDIWRWFDENHSKGVAWLMHQWTREKMQARVKQPLR